MRCPACGFDNLQGSDRCENCMEPLAKLDVPQPGVGLQKRLMEDAISHLSPTPAVTISVNASVREAIQLLRDRKVGCVLVLEEGQLRGIFSERDLLDKLAGSDVSLDDIPIKNVMTINPVGLTPEDSIRFALHQMSLGGFRHIPIVKENLPLAIISIKDVLRYINREVLRGQAEQTAVG